MSEKKSTGMKSAYEIALEKLENQGIDRPDEGSLSEEVRQQMAEVRRETDAKLAELKILHKDRLAAIGDPSARQEEENEYQQERRRIEAERDRELDRLRREASGG